MFRVLRSSSAVVYALALAYLLLLPPGRGLQLFPHADKVAHFIAFGILAVFILRALTDPRAPRPPAFAWIVAFALSISYAVGMEFLQEKVGRVYSVGDMVAGALGIVVVSLLWNWSRKRFVLFR